MREKMNRIPLEIATQSPTTATVMAVALALYLVCERASCEATAAGTVREGSSYDPSGPGTSWIGSGGSLEKPRGLSSVFFYNQSFVIVGGCKNVGCSEMSSAISQYDPLHDEMIGSTIEFPLFFTIPSPNPKLPPTFTRASFAGPTAVVPVSSWSFLKSTLDVQLEPWLVGPCALYFTFQGNASRPEVYELYHGVWGLSKDLSDIRVFSRLPNSLPLRGNATCQSYGDRIFIIGGVWIDTLEPVETIDAYDTRTQTYIPSVFVHVEAVMNPGVTIDNRMMYVVGGQTTNSNCSVGSSSYLFSHPSNVSKWKGNSRSQANTMSSDALQEVFVHYCQSSKATAYYFPSTYWLNESLPLKQYFLPEIPRKLVERVEFVREETMERKVVIPEMLRIFSFSGSLCVSSFTSLVSTIEVEMLTPSGQPDPTASPSAPSSSSSQSSSSGDGWKAGRRQHTHFEMDEWTIRLLTPAWSLSSVKGLEISDSSMILFPIPDVFFGIGLALFSFGGISYSQQFGEGRMTSQIYQRFVGLSMPSVWGRIPSVQVVGDILNISLQPPMSGYVRLSDNLACYGNAVGTEDAYVNTSLENPSGHTTVTFVPMTPADQVYACFSFGDVFLTSSGPSIMFFSVINPFTPFAILNQGSPIGTPSPGASSGSLWETHKVVILSSAVPCVAVLLALLGFIVARRHRMAAGGNINNDEEDSVNGNPRNLRSGLLSDRLINSDPKDKLIRDTTCDSRYKVLKRVGEGAFSSVYLVCPKNDPKNLTYAMKFMVCADDRERLEAIKECETINSVQGHPSIIRLYDMFMNYEFGSKRSDSALLSETDQALLLTSSMHAIQVNRKPTPSASNATPQSPALQSPLQVGTAPNERTPLSPAGVGRPYKGRSTLPAGGLDDFPSAPLPAVHNRYLCLVMEYHPSGDLCRYTLKRAHELAAMQPVKKTSSFAEMQRAVIGRSPEDFAEPLRVGTPSDAPASSSSVGGCQQQHALSEAQILSVAYQIASVLQFLHSQRPPIVHRDLKPENILIRGPLPQANDPFIPVVVTDFGLAFIQEEHRKSGRGGGTRPYISPESWKGQTTTASDVWGLGCVLYALATERLTSETVRVMFQDSRYPSFTKSILSDLIRTHKYSPEFAVFVASILDADPKKRPTAERLVKMFEVRSSVSPDEANNGVDGGVIVFKKDAFGPNGALSLVPFECTLLSGSGLPVSSGSDDTPRKIGSVS